MDILLTACGVIPDFPMTEPSKAEREGFFCIAKISGCSYKTKIILLIIVPLNYLPAWKKSHFRQFPSDF